MPLSDAVKAAICAKLADGQSLVQALKADGMPSRSHFYEQVAADPEFADMYARAKADGIEAMADDLMAIADEAEVANVTDAEGNVVDLKLDYTAVARNRLRVDTRKWLLAKLAPKKYGDKIEHEHKGGLSVTLTSQDAAL